MAACFIMEFFEQFFFGHDGISMFYGVAFFGFAINQTNKGAPIPAVMTPTGNSRPGINILAKVSHKTRNPAPQIADMGISIRRELPSHKRMRWGTMSPTKAMGPHQATDAPTPSAPIPRVRVLTLVTDTPWLWALSSPRTNESNALICEKMMVIETNAKGIMRSTPW